MTAPVSECAADACAPATGAAPSGDAPQINPATGLSTDYLNHFSEAIMALEMIATMPECADDLRAWRPKSYCQHFAASNFANRDAAIAAYADADPAAVDVLERTVETLDAILPQVRDVVLRHLGTPDAAELARRAVSWLRPLVARAAAAINGKSMTQLGRDTQAEIDAIFAS